MELTIKKPAASKATKWWVLGTVCFALFMVNLDGNVVSLAIPTIVRDFNATLAQMEWVTNAYLLTFAVFLITLGRLGDEIGRKKLFLSGLILFTIGSALCGAAANISQLIAFRVVQGVGGSAMMPATLSLIAANFEQKERGRAMGFWGAVSGLAFIAGPIVGGYLTQNGLGPFLNSLIGVEQLWRYVFYLNLPFGLLAVIAGLLLIPESRDPESKRRLDLPGVLLSSIAVFLLTYGFIEGPRLGWWTAKSAFMVGSLSVSPVGLSVVPFLFAAAVVAAVAFLLYEHKRKWEPLVDLSLFRVRNYSVGMTLGVILNFAVMGATFLLPLFFQGVLGITPIRTGEILIPFALALLVTSPLAGILSDRIEGKYIVMAGLMILGLSDLIMAHFRVTSTPADTLLAFVVMGVGMGLSMTPLTNLTIAGIPAGRVGGASGVLSTTRQIGAVMGIAIFSMVLQSAMSGNVASRASESAIIPPAARSVLVDYVSAGGMYGTGDGSQEAIQAQMIKAMAPSAQGAAAAPVSGSATVASGTTTAAAAQGFEPPAAAGSTAADSAQTFMQKIGAEIELVMKQGFTDSINDTLFVASFFGFGGALLTLLLRPVRSRSKACSKSTSVEEAPVEVISAPELALPVRDPSNA